MALLAAMPILLGLLVRANDNDLSLRILGQTLDGIVIRTVLPLIALVFGTAALGAELDDGTGRIWVMTTKGVPSRGARVGASGRVQTGVSFGGRTYGTVLEEEHRQTRTY